MNIKFAAHVLQSLAAQGVQDFCICPGARNAPLIEILSRTSSLNLMSFFDERSASFFALGRARRDQRPVAVVTTSGTAVAELLPAAIEAFYSDTPLILISADRPKRLRGTGAPQSIEQSGLFAQYVEKSWDLSPQDRTDIKLETKKPYHINLCFDEPLIEGDDSERPTTVEGPQFLEASGESIKTNPQFSKVESEGAKGAPPLENALVVVGSLLPTEVANVAAILRTFDVPIYLEATSGLRADAKIKSLPGGEKMVARLIRSGEIKNVIRIGDVPLGRYWRDLDQLAIPIHSFSNKAFSGTDKSDITKVDLSEWQGLPVASWEWSQWEQEANEKAKAIAGLLREFPLSEVAFFNRFQDSLAEGESLYVGNSLPIRMWDLVSRSSGPVHCNRGANGIDGQVSTAFGWMLPKSQNRVILGDLTTLYDFNGLWMSPYLKAEKIDVELIVVNNGGGKIFSRIFENPIFQNKHDLNFKAMADFWGWNYSRLEDPALMRPAMGLGITEWTPDEKQSQYLWQRYDQLWKK